MTFSKMSASASQRTLAWLLSASFGLTADGKLKTMVALSIGTPSACMIWSKAIAAASRRGSGLKLLPPGIPP
jgi:hypothetical protein